MYNEQRCARKYGSMLVNLWIVEMVWIAETATAVFGRARVAI